MAKRIIINQKENLSRVFCNDTEPYSNYNLGITIGNSFVVIKEGMFRENGVMRIVKETIINNNMIESIEVYHQEDHPELCVATVFNKP